MPKNKGKGGKNRKRGKNEADDEKRELIFKEDGQEYAQVLRMLGNGRCEAMCIDGTKRLCHIRGKMHKKVWIAAGDIILVGLRDYQDDKADVILKYMPDEARLLKAYGELPENTRLNEGTLPCFSFGSCMMAAKCNCVIRLPVIRLGSLFGLCVRMGIIANKRGHTFSSPRANLEYSCVADAIRGPI
ncbi:hypothetical protein POTOM_048655 [Populus tomentosa]|uniref:Eukaryotic translation initiation factor 4C n=1 Tax=Populus tomentosa TaxID=118781 RepID=A0A8X7YFP5_POPTO|nr:hypothetical protein POTOM_048655 [Populus tomentosa]